jgi:hypothetical protein
MRNHIETYIFLFGLLFVSFSLLFLVFLEELGETNHRVLKEEVLRAQVSFLVSEFVLFTLRETVKKVLKHTV